MQVKELAKKPIGILKHSTMSDVIKKLLENHISRLVVLDSGNPVGIISQKDVGFFLFNDSTKYGLDKIPLSSIMNDIEYVDGSTTVEKCAKTLIDKKISSLCVKENSQLGIFTKTDLATYYSKNYSKKHKVVDFMTHDYISTHNATPLFKVVRKMLEHRISRIITKSQNEQPAGILSFKDLFRISLELGNEEDDEGFTLSDQIRRGFLSEKGFGSISLAKDVMSKEILTVKFSDDLENACKIMLNNNVSGLAVIDGNGGVTGMISKTDVIRALSSMN
ncbi:CBS domain-containing protein [Candidatus Nitrosotenuis chungbukensis]|uniref:CBS domain-containing protein n=1 Tax=Candidatus Nitrosotenuis chungbukensis TaxID=1353246 RepID=UPI0005B28720|nr:CBS domain-containing protein [Candidatus Nitrosotenuis chungbukensis]WKT57967.1 CBS domain-containing protein [Candidatus Nitrosotenuis chungbukensis]